jgi:hypothetical protein
MRRLLLTPLCGWLLCLASWGVAAQDMKVEVENSPLHCLQRVDPDLKPEYPADAMESRRGAYVRARLTFTTPAAGPRVEILGNSSGDGSFESYVRRVAGNYRLPCLAEAGSPFVTTQEFSFEPRDSRPVSWSEVAPDTDRLEYCVSVDGQPYPWKRGPEFPRSMIGSTITGGQVLVSMKFTSPTLPPEVTVLFDGGQDRLARAVKTFLDDVRLPCLPAGQTVTVKIPFQFLNETVSRIVLKDLTLQQFLSAVDSDALSKPINRVRFDLDAMACPFDVRLKLWQPYDQNTVGQVGAVNPRRAPLLGWLASLPLALTKAQMSAVLGQSIVISVPCGTVDLT